MTRPTRRQDLPPLERAVSDTLDEYLIRLHGLATSWTNPYEFIEWLEKRGYKLVLIEKKSEEKPQDSGII